MLWPDVTELKVFYDSAIGQVATKHLRRVIQQIWPEAKGETLLGIGYPLPCLRPFLKSADIVCVAMPSAQGVIHWPRGHEMNMTFLTHDMLIPLRSSTLNRIILMHALEHSQPVSELLKEAERLLTPAGRMLIIVPNRRSLWARAEHTPYGHGHPFHLSQLKRILDNHQFGIIQTRQALFFPPFGNRNLLRFAPMIERFGQRFFPHFGGAIILEVEKQKPAKVKGTPVKALAEPALAVTSFN